MPPCRSARRMRGPLAAILLKRNEILTNLWNSYEFNNENRMKKNKPTKTRSRNSEYYQTKRQAFRSGKKDNKIPVSKQPDETVKPNTKRGDEENLDKRNRRMFIFNIDKGMFKKDERIYFREDKAVEYSDGSKQGNHFNVGSNSKKLGNHYYYEK